MPVVQYQSGNPLPNKIYLDSNVVIAFLYGNHTFHMQASTFMLDAIAGGKELLLSPLAVDELWHILMSCWHKDQTSTKFDGGKPAHVARHSAAISGIIAYLKQLSNLRIVGHGNHDAFVMEALQVLASFHFGARDSFHAALVELEGIPSIATMDSGFDRLGAAKPHLTVLKIA